MATDERAAAVLDDWTGEDVTVRDVERRARELRAALAGDGETHLRTSVLTHVAWVPPEWEQAAVDTLEGLAERHPSRAILLLPEGDAEADGIDAQVAVRCFALAGQARNVCSEVIELRLRGRTTAAPASIVAPLLIADLPVFLRWRGRPDFGGQGFQGLVDLVDRLVVDSGEWRDVGGGYRELASLFAQVAVSDIAWARGLPWRRRLAELWPEIARISRLDVTGPEADALLLVGWLRSRLGSEIELRREDARRIDRVAVDGEPVSPPLDPPQSASDLLSDELDQFGRDRIYEEAVRAASR